MHLSIARMQDAPNNPWGRCVNVHNVCLTFMSTDAALWRKMDAPLLENDPPRNMIFDNSFSDNDAPFHTPEETQIWS